MLVLGIGGFEACALQRKVNKVNEHARIVAFMLM